MTRPSNIFVRFAAETGGSITVEFIVILPLLLAALVFVFELGRAFLAYEIVAQDVRSSVRYLSRASNNSDTPPTPQSALVTNAKNLAETGNVSNTCPSNCHYPWTGQQITVSTASGCRDGAGTLIYNEDCSIITMTASIPMTLSSLAFIGAGTAYTLSVTDTAQYIGD